ncbi:MAG: hypothetical protein MZV64_17375 [Ignavibacteriales bacterium]|nr:hypothetical protein [Ignavibacteriales bacterium]
MLPESTPTPGPDLHAPTNPHADPIHPDRNAPASARTADRRSPTRLPCSPGTARQPTSATHNLVLPSACSTTLRSGRSPRTSSATPPSVTAPSPIASFRSPRGADCPPMSRSSRIFCTPTRSRFPSARLLRTA